MLNNGDSCPIVTPRSHLVDLADYVVRAKGESEVFLKLDS